MEDVLEKYLRYEGYDVNRVMNITDVRAPGLRRGHRRGQDAQGVPSGSTRPSWRSPSSTPTPFLQDCAKLNIKTPDIVQPATGCIDGVYQDRLPA